MKKRVHLLCAVVILSLFSINTATLACEPECDPCYEWDDDLKECVWTCEEDEFCCTGTSGDVCCEECCNWNLGLCFDGLGYNCGGDGHCCQIGWYCADPSSHKCCPNEYGYCEGDCCLGECCNDQKCCDYGYFCTEDDECCPTYNKCGVNDCCESEDPICCGNECCPIDRDCCNFDCCPSDKPTCCGGPGGYGVCCDEWSRCCYNLDCCEEGEICCSNGDCNTPCWEDVVDTTSCDESKSTPCFGCNQLTPQTACENCPVYRDYSGVDIKDCHDGCPGDHDIFSAGCYEKRECLPMLKNDSWCTECGGVVTCIEVVDIGGGDCQTIGECVVQMACDIATICWECEEGGDVIDTTYERTCECE